MTAITVKTDDTNSLLDDCFGKSEYFFIYDSKSGVYEFIKNPVKDSKKMSGKKAASFLIEKGIKTLITTNIGSEVKRIFDKNNIQIVIISKKFRYLKDIKWINLQR
jgi:predicted Fe-Mo cluster-binding NifX family protein